MITIPAPNFDLAATLGSGQVFHWSAHEDGFVGLTARKPMWISQRGNELFVRSGTEKAVRDYFALDHPVAKIRASFPKDEWMSQASAFCRGLRIIRQPVWECLATFITSSMKQVAHIRQMSLAIRQRFGSPVAFEGLQFFTYPSPEKIAAADEAELRDCKLGYRAKNLIRTAAMIADGKVDLEKIRAMDDDDALAELQKLPGVGAKVANCVLLFAYERLSAFPIDVWIERVLREQYFRRKRAVTRERMQNFARDYFGEFGGYAQQYLFHHARSLRKISA